LPKLATLAEKLPGKVRKLAWVHDKFLPLLIEYLCGRPDGDHTVSTSTFDAV
jgi:hypothetical protein